ncbi:MAG: hypothetical protein NC822_05020 [Candidatus Omnitrophica bacterium]|nr:hypothetical protein [Candidatus Omnitrophota bacterium]
MFKFKYLLFLLFLGACTYAKYVDNYYTIPNFSKLKVSDVGFVGFVSKEKLPQDIISRVNDIFSTELERRNWYRVHRLKEDDLKDFDKLSNIDALIEGEIICYKELEPLKFGLRVWMKYINTGQTIWSSSYIFDASAKEVVYWVKDYYKSKFPKYPLLSYRAFLISIDKFVEFSCNRIIDTIEISQKKVGF